MMDDSLKTFGKFFGAVCVTVAVLAQSHFYVENQNLAKSIALFDTPVKTQKYAGAKDLILAIDSSPNNVFAFRVAAQCAAKGDTPVVGAHEGSAVIVCSESQTGPGF